MSEYINAIMKQYNCSLAEAMEIIERRDMVMSWIFNTYQPYGKVLH